ncbi:Restriction of telomere capping protein 5 [Zancudomyces culisetae]|uniref:Restriction of telomere capping protein 5 n=1 Tax=Zancudomyces culisetae TaxID=1213189 RepID=A0A1R1PSQ3_ZANCU|nr:Restriction of telomere capping protein 5 [Zancudomyces culisetae]|eukprot:OMH83974.1 Restriction of telomere capping protein 5 [Zancudomyces culisetae]
MGQYLAKSNINPEEVIAEANETNGAARQSDSERADNSGSLNMKARGMHKTSSIPIKKARPTMGTNLEEVYTKLEIASFIAFWNFLEDSKLLKKGKIDLEGFRAVFKEFTQDSPECGGQLVDYLFYSIWCLQKWFKTRDTSDISEKLREKIKKRDVCMRRTAFLAGLSVYLFDREPPKEFISADMEYGTSEDLWKLKIELIMKSFIVVQDALEEKREFGMDNEMRTDNLVFTKQEVDLDLEQELCVEKTESKSVSNEMDDFLAALKVADNTELPFETFGSKMQLKTLGNIVQGLYYMYVFPTICNLEDLRSRIVNNDVNNDEIPVYSEKMLASELQYVMNFVRRSVDDISIQNRKFRIDDEENISLDSLLLWVDYCGDGIFANISNFLLNVLLGLTTELIEDSSLENFSIRKLAIEGHLYQIMLGSPSTIIIRPAMFVLTWKATSTGNTWGRTVNLRRTLQERLSTPSYSASLNRQSIRSNSAQRLSFPREQSDVLSQSAKCESKVHSIMGNHVEKGSILNGMSVWDMLFRADRDGFGNRSFLNKALHYPAPTVMLISGTISDASKSRANDIRLSQYCGSSLKYTPSISCSEVPEDIFPLKAGDQIKLGVYVPTEWIESATKPFGDHRCFIFIIEPYFQLINGINHETIQEIKDYAFDQTCSYKKAGDPSAKSSMKLCRELCYITSSSATGIHLGGNITQTKLSESYRKSSLGADNGSSTQVTETLILELSNEVASLINDPFVPSEKQTFCSFSKKRAFRVDINVANVELYGLGGPEAWSAQEKYLLFEKKDVSNRKSLNTFKLLKQHGLDEDQLHTARWLLQTSGIISSEKPVSGL